MHPSRRISLWITATAFALLSACGGGSGSAPQATVSTPATPSTPTTVTDVYVAGYQWGTGMDNTAVYWKNGRPVKLDPGVSGGFGATAITVSKGDVYVVGNQFGNNPNAALYWKNGTPVPLSASGRANAIAVSSTGDVYVVGDDATGAKLWKNGIGTKLNVTSMTPLKSAIATGIALVGQDVYVSGAVTKEGSMDNAQAIYWKNGQDTLLGTANLSCASCIITVGSEIRMGGFTYQTGASSVDIVTWRPDGSEQKLFSTPSISIVKGLWVQGGKTLAAGTIGSDGNTCNGFFWDGSTQSDIGASISGVAVSGSDIYLTGSALLTNVPTLWKNNAPTTLPLLSGASHGNVSALCVDTH
ncbi:MAG TPA: hypothetical protein PKL14_09405 [Holophaga sp.]|nr:hypothetical protein [Holophaga sp.]